MISNITIVSKLELPGKKEVFEFIEKPHRYWGWQGALWRST